METFFTADHHFGHRAILNFTERPFNDLDEMNEELIWAWNARVKPKDQVFHLGDISFMSSAQTRGLLERLNGRIYYIRGNHDKAIKGSTSDRFEWVKDYYELKLFDERIILCHYAFEVWNKSHFGSWHLHGHSHGSLVSHRELRRMDVGVDTRPDYAPYSYEEVKGLIGDNKYTAVDHHRDKTGHGVQEKRRNETEKAEKGD